MAPPSSPTLSIIRSALYFFRPHGRYPFPLSLNRSCLYPWRQDSEHQRLWAHVQGQDGTTLQGWLVYKATELNRTPTD